MIKEVHIAGVYVAPFAFYLLVAALAYLPLRLLFNWCALERFVWHRSLFDLAVFAILLALIVLAF